MPVLEPLRETSGREWYCANCGRNWHALTVHGRCIGCDSDAVGPNKEFPGRQNEKEGLENGTVKTC